MTMHMDPNEIRSSGTHPFVRLYDSPDAEKSSTNLSVWQVHYNPEAGPGNVAFLQSDELTNGEVRVYSDNEKLARWVQQEVGLDPSDTSLPVRKATFQSDGDLTSSLTLNIDAQGDKLSCTWAGFIPAFASVHDPLPERLGGNGHYAVYVPAQQVRVSLNGMEAKGAPRPQPFGEWQGTSCFVVLGETWMRPATS
jgi:hypothetical protein